MTAARAFLWFDAFVLTLYAVGFFYDPALLGVLVNLELQGPNAYTEIFAFYGGLELGIATYLAWAAMKPERVGPALVFFAFAFGAAGAARTLGCLLYGFEDPAHPIVAAIEVGFAVVAIGLHRFAVPQVSGQ